MHKQWFAAALFLVGWIAACSFHQTNAPAFAQPADVEQANLLMANVTRSNGDQQVILVDTQQRVMSCYHVSAEAGEITLKSVRNLRWDMMMDNFNGTEPKPKEIRALLEQR